MRALVQRVSSSSVEVDGEVVGRIGAGFLVYIGVAATDSDDDAAYIQSKILHLRVFPDENEKLNRSIVEHGGQLLLVSAFSLYADARKGRRPSFIAAAAPELAERLFSSVGSLLTASGVRVETGRFRAHMYVTSVNDGPICIPLDSSRLF